jgi:hypothetical protein
VFRPKQMSPEQLFERWQGAWKSFYSTASILDRFRHAPFISLFSLLSFLPLNLHQKRVTAKKIIGGNRFFLRDG